MLSYLRCSIQTFFYVGFGVSERIYFIKAYGLDILNYINFESKFFLLLVLQSLIAFVLCFIRIGFANTPFTLVDLLTGQCPFQDFVGLYTLLAIEFSLLTYCLIGKLKANAREFHYLVMLEDKVYDNKYVIMSNCVYIGRISRSVNKKALEEEIQKALGIYPTDFLLLLFPKLFRLSSLLREMNMIKDVYQSRINQ